MQDQISAETGDVQPLRLKVLDTEDLAVVSALLQDADVTVRGMTYLPRQARFALVVSRFDWPAAQRGRLERCWTGLHFDGVRHVAQSGLGSNDLDRTHRLLAMSFTADDPPAGTLLLRFAGHAQIKLTVECLEAEMRDIGPRWRVDEKPTATEKDFA